MNSKTDYLKLQSKSGEQKEKRMKRSEESLRHLQDTTKLTNICTTGVPEGEERDWDRRLI